MADAKTQVVPVEPTKAMLEAVSGFPVYGPYLGRDEAVDIWYALYDTAPQPADVPHDVGEVLSELADLMDAVVEGEYKPDSFTTQPARAVLRTRATPAPSPSTATPDLDDWAYAFANWRQGQRSTPSCEAPGAADIRICRDLIEGMLACRPSALAAPSTSTEEALRAENARLRAALRNNFCPRPCNHRPAQFEVGGCVDAGECGCMNVTALSTPR
ncbi:hypothetical protein [Aurantimonas coralicida]|uniref:hypothetical protein n=1 Tax=Aurantimonas coralicida TaxID=182270 RepID=UPI003516BC84